MLEKIFKKAVFNYYLVFVLLVLTPVGGYFLAKIIPVDRLSGEGIVFQTISFLILLIFIPTALKIFSIKIKALQNEENTDIKLTKYLYWFNIRLLLVTVPLLLNILLYYLTHDNSMLFAAGICAIALLFCKPMRKKMIEELNIIENE